MANKENKIDPLNSARVHDGWAYIVTLKSGVTQTAYDHDNLERVLARLDSANAGLHPKRLVFSGAKEEVESDEEVEGTETGEMKLEIKGPEYAAAFDTDDISAIRYKNWRDDEDPKAYEAAVEAARVLLTIQGEAAQAAAEEMMSGEDEDEQEQGRLDADGMPDLTGAEGEPAPTIKPEFQPLED